MLYCFNTPDDGKSISATALLQRIKSGDIDKKEIVVGVAEPDSPLAKQLTEAGMDPVGVKAACDLAVKRINAELKIKE